MKVDGNQEFSLAPQLGRLHLCVGNCSLYRCLCVVLVLGFRGFKLWGNFVTLSGRSSHLSLEPTPCQARGLRAKNQVSCPDQCLSLIHISEPTRLS